MKIFLSGVIFLFLLSSVLFFAWQADTGVTQNLPVQRSYTLDRDFFVNAYQGSRTRFTSHWVYGGIVPHHLLASHVIADFFQNLEQDNQPAVVVVIGPNHREVGNGDSIISQAKWQTPYGDLLPATDIINKLIQRGVVQVNERVFTEEHSISAEVSFIKKIFPRARFVPIVLEARFTEAEAKKLAKTLTDVLPARSLVLASADFSHYVSSDIADQQDRKSIEILQAFNFAEVAKMNVDSKPTIFTLLHYLDYINARQSVLSVNSNAAKVTGDLNIKEVTSYVTMYFTH